MKNVIDFESNKLDMSIGHQELVSKEIHAFVKFIVDRTGKSAVSIINTCAMDDSPYWRPMFEAGMADAISEDPALENEFLGRMCAKPGLPHASKLIDAYLQGMPSDRKEKLFSITGIKKRGHHFSVCFYGASFKNSCGTHLLEVLKVMIVHGLPLQTLIDRNQAEVERAIFLRHTDFLKTITATGAKIPDEIIKSIMQRGQKDKDGRDIELISMLIDDCGVSVEHLMSVKFSEDARPSVRSYLQSRRVRGKRIPETVIDPEEEDHYENA